MKEISLHILDIMENSVSGKASRIVVEITIDKPGNKMIIQITDNGYGMDAETLTLAMNPFFTTRTTRKIGMGIPLFRQQAEQTGGELTLKSEPGKGTCLTAILGLNHIDRQPLGDLAGVMVNLASSYPDIDIQLTMKTDKGSFHFSSHEIAEMMEGIPLNTPQMMLSLKELIETNINELI